MLGVDPLTSRFALLEPLEASRQPSTTGACFAGSAAVHAEAGVLGDGLRGQPHGFHWCHLRALTVIPEEGPVTDTAA